MLQTIEQHPTGVINKIITRKGRLLGYQSVPVGKAGDYAGCLMHGRLYDARRALGVMIHHPVKLTTPKADCPHNQPGYRPDMAAKAKAKAKGNGKKH